MVTPERTDAARGKSEPKRLEYRPPTLARLGKLADVTLASSTGSNMDGAMPPPEKTV